MSEEKKKHPGGRPTEYLPEFCESAYEYLATCQDYFDQNVIKVKIPTIEGFAYFIGITKPTIYEWEKKYPEFAYALGFIRDEQKHRLMNEGLAGNYNSTIAKLILSANHGVNEKSEQDLTSLGKSLTILFDDAFRNREK